MAGKVQLFRISVLFSFVGMQTQLIRIEESENNLEINLFAEVEELENVEVVKKRKKTYIDKYREYNHIADGLSWGPLWKPIWLIWAKERQL